ncbi:MAG: hypothetical protein ACON4N_13495 [Myxococcota bacterium]
MVSRMVTVLVAFLASSVYTTDASAFCYKYSVSYSPRGEQGSRKITYAVSREGFFQTTDFYDAIKKHVELTLGLPTSVSAKGGRTSGSTCSKSELSGVDVVI